MLRQARPIWLTCFLVIGLVGCVDGRESKAKKTSEFGARADRHTPAAAGLAATPTRVKDREAATVSAPGPDGKTNPGGKPVVKPAPPPPAWQVIAVHGAEAKLDLAADGLMNVSMPKLSDGTPWHVQLMGPVVPFVAGTRHSVSFRGRATEPRKLVVMAFNGKSPGEPIGLYQEVPLTQEWRSFRLDFEPRGDTDQAQLRFYLGMNQAGVELADVAFGPQHWSLRAGGDSNATLEIPPGLATALRVIPGEVVDSEKPWIVTLKCSVFPVVEGEQYYVSLRGRADKTRKVIAKVGMGQEPWTALGCYRIIELGTDWKSHGFTFKATASDPAAAFDLLLGDSDTPLELQSASVRPKEPWMLTAAKDHEAVLTFPAADGLRPAADGTVSPVSGDLMRVDFGRQPASEEWRVRLAAAPRAVRLDSDYEVVFKARAERPRDLVATLRQADANDRVIGLWAKVSLTDAWQTFTRRFNVKSATDRAVLGFELGGSDAAVEIADVEIR